MTREEAILCLKGMKNYARDTFTEQADWQDSLDMAIETLKAEPTKHGHWIRTHFASPVWKCSVCGANYNRASMIGANWCEACGAKMDWDEVEE